MISVRNNLFCIDDKVGFSLPDNCTLVFNENTHAGDKLAFSLDGEAVYVEIGVENGFAPIEKILTDSFADGEATQSCDVFSANRPHIRSTNSRAVFGECNGKRCYEERHFLSGTEADNVQLYIYAESEKGKNVLSLPAVQAFLQSIKTL